MESIYLTEIRELGPEAAEFIGAGLVILFETGAPPELAEMSVLHEPISKRDEPPQAGDVLALGSEEFRITAIGEKAWSNVHELGHVVLKFNGLSETELPGEMYVEETEDLSELFQPGAKLEIKEANS